MAAQPRIGIVGAGPGGLTLARILHIHGIRASIFEREPHSAARSQGGSLDMHVESGQHAIECAGLTTEFKRIARYEDQEFRVYDQQGNLQFIDESNDGNRPEVDRGHLRQMLLDSLPDGMIRWGHELSSVNTHEDGTSELLFKNGVSETFDLVVGADGAWSRIRPLLSDAKPVYSGVMFAELGIPAADVKHPELARLVGHGMMFALGDSKAIIGHRDANAHIGIYAGLRTSEDWHAIDVAEIAAEFSGWSDHLLQLIHASSERIAPRPIYALPVGHRWENRAGVTLLGDAAHLMSPFSGEGANLAMLDGAELALGLVAEQDWREAVRQYEVKMLARAEQAAAGAWDAVNDVFSADGLAHLLQQVKTHHA